MKRFLRISGLLLLLCPVSVSAQTDEAAQLLLNVEKLAQLKQLLSDMKKGYDVLKGGYKTVKNLSEGNFSLHKAFLDGLLEVSPAVRDYYKVGGIINHQIRLVKEYKRAFDRYKVSGLFKPEELLYLGRVYNRLLKSSLQNLDELATILTAGQLRMSDDERLEAIDRIYSDMEDKLLFLRSFNSETTLLAIGRLKEVNQVEQMKTMYGVTK